jgi:O-antigen ligase
MSPITETMNGTRSGARRISVVRENAAGVAVARVRAVVRWGTLGALVAAPLGFGATTVTGAVLLAAAAWLLLLLWVVAGVAAGELRLPSHPAMLPAVLVLGYGALHWAAGWSVAPYAGQLEWLRWLGYAALAIVALDSFATPQRLKLLCGVLGVAGFGTAVLGIAQYLTANGKIYWMIEPQFGGWIFGPYVNRNHFAGLMELWLPLALALALVARRSAALRWMWFTMALVMAAAVVLSGSRGGVISLGIALCLFLLAVAAIRGGRRAFAVFALALIVLSGTVLALDKGELRARYSLLAPRPGAVDEELAGHRLQAWRDTLTLFRQNWLLGSGLETFETLFPAVRSFPSDRVWSHAHSDYLQWLAELGLLGGALAAWAIVAVAGSALRNIRRTIDSDTGWLLLGAACACLGFMIHGWVDFNFHVPANAANFAVLAAVLGRRGWDEI